MNYIFCLVSLLGAFLLFQVQPMISKFILPWFGGSPGVWTTCMLFFQQILFGGYAYAHLLSRRKPATQAMVHVVLLVAAVLVLPIVPHETLKPTGSESSPAWKIFLLLLATVGLPYFVLSATSPLVQVWYGRVYPHRSPFRLYSLSNLGSLTALLSYPLFFEPRWDVLQQAWFWSIGFGAFALLMATCAVGEWKRGSSEASEQAHDDAAADAKLPGPTPWRRAAWIILPAFASVMLLATTNHVCQDVAVIPFLWVIPLALYLLTFIICFDHPRWYLRPAWAIPAMIVLFVVSWGWSPNIVVEILLNFTAMFLICMVCHGELARLKPGTSHLTEYYLLMSAGGALGGITVSLIAPVIFTTFMEWSLGLLVGFAFVSWVAYRGLVKAGNGGINGRLIALLLCSLLASVYCLRGWLPESLSASLPKTIAEGLELNDSNRTVPWQNIAVSCGLVLGAFLLSRGLLAKNQAAKQRAYSWGFLSIVLCAMWGILDWEFSFSQALERSRNFYGTLSVRERETEAKDTNGKVEKFRSLYCSGTEHGRQFLSEALKREPLTYYGKETAVGQLLLSLKDQPDAKIGIIGMGTATLAAYGEAGQTFRFYEINPEVERFALKHFSFITDMIARGAKYELALGDARLQMASEPDQHYDALVLDAFSGDSVPAHLLTKEAFAIYQRHLKPQGVIAVHITNHYLNLAPVVERLAKEYGFLTTRQCIDPGGLSGHYQPDYLLLSKDAAFIKAHPPVPPTNAIDIPDIPLWTDHAHNLFQILQRQ